MICEVRSDSWFCDLSLARFWYGGWVFVGCDMGLNFMVVGFVGLVMLNGVAVNVLRWRSGLVLWVHGYGGGLSRAQWCGRGSQVKSDFLSSLTLMGLWLG